MSDAYGEVYFFTAGTHPYVGQAVYRRGGFPWGGARRLEEHKREAASCAKPQCIKCSSIKKYGITHFEILAANVSTSEALDEAEIFWIVQKNSFHGNNPAGLNMDRGGRGIHGYRHSEEIRALIGQSRVGYHHSKETRLKMSISQRAWVRKPLSDDHRKKLSESNKGKKRSEEARRNLSASKTGDKNPMSGLKGQIIAHIRFHIEKEICRPDRCTLCAIDERYGI